jgi:hypothetical protein
VDSHRKAELKRAYKQTPQRKGVFKVRCSTSGETWVDTSTNLDSIKNRIWFSLRMGNHHNKKLQQAWNKSGEEAMHYVIVEVFEADVSGYALERLLKERKAYWLEALQAESCQ